MNQKNHYDKNESGREERQKAITFLRKAVTDSFARGNSTWEDLNYLALEAISEANWCIRQKKYRLFGMYLQLYSDIWQYAHSHLKPMEYQYFCLCQAEPNCEYVM